MDISDSNTEKAPQGSGAYICRMANPKNDYTRRVYFRYPAFIKEDIAVNPAFLNSFYLGSAVSPSVF
jgi:hypothetical protein